MATLTALAIIIYAFYFLFIKGNAYAILLFGFGVFGGTTLIKHFFPITEYTIATFMTYNISIAVFAATIITILGISFFMENE
jgi:hypothetical protein